MNPPVHRMASARLWLACGVGWLLLAAGLAVAWHRVAERRFVRELEKTAARGREWFYWGVMYGPDETLGPEAVGPPRWGIVTDASNHTYRNTRDLIVQSITGGCFRADWAHFAAPGVPVAKGGPENFGSTNHAWRIVADLTAERAIGPSPALWSKNLTITNVGQQLTRDDQGLPRELCDIPPFGRGGFVFITQAGRAHVLYGDQLRFDAFTNAFHFRHLEGPNAPGPEPEALTNRVLDP